MKCEREFFTKVYRIADFKREVQYLMDPEIQSVYLLPRSLPDALSVNQIKNYIQKTIMLLTRMT